MNYVLGFAHCLWSREILLIQKQSPEWQQGLYNGIGGKQEPGETSIETMVREFHEETLITTTRDDWTLICDLVNSDEKWMVRVYTASLWPHEYQYIAAKESLKLLPKEAEQPRFFSIEDFNEMIPWIGTKHNQIVPNLSWLVPMSRLIAFHSDSSKQNYAKIIYS